MTVWGAAARVLACAPGAAASHALTRPAAHNAAGMVRRTAADDETLIP
jgi:hypothetical protein